MGVMASAITGVSIVYSTVYSGADQRKYQSSVLLPFVRGIHRWPSNSPHKGPVTRKMFSFDDVIMIPISRMEMVLERSSRLLACVKNDIFGYMFLRFYPNTRHYSQCMPPSQRCHNIQWCLWNSETWYRLSMNNHHSYVSLQKLVSRK